MGNPWHQIYRQFLNVDIKFFLKLDETSFKEFIIGNAKEYFNE